MKKVAIVIVHYSGVRNTTQCLQSIEKLQITNYKLQIIVVDNNPKEQFTVDNSQLTDTVKIIKSNENLGFSGGNNVGIQYALDHKADYVLILNNDTIVHKNLINELLEVAESDEKIGIVVPKIYFAKGYEFHKDRYKKGELGKVIWYAGGIIDWDNVVGKHRGVDEVDNGQYDQVEPTEFASGCCFLVKIEVFEKVGFFDEKYFLYYEDADLSMRINKAGHAIMYVPKAILWHKNAGAAGGSGSTLQDYYITRNRLIFGMRYAPLRSKLALIKQSVHLMFNGRSWQKRGIRDFYLRRFWKGSYRI